MNGSNQRRSSRSSSLATSPTEDNIDWDAISLTSTVEPEQDSDTEYVVEAVQAEGENEIDGERKKVFLVEWANFPLDQCTWEPLENLSQELAEQWEKKKATQDASVAEEFTEKFRVEYNKKLEESRHRHRLRNKKRRRLALRTTPFYFRNIGQFDSDDEADFVQGPPDSEPEPSSHSSEGYESGEAEEDNSLDHKATSALIPFTPSSKAKALKAPRPASSIFTTKPDKAHSSENSKTANGQRKDSTPSWSSKTQTARGSSKDDRRPQSSKRISRDRELPSATGYQGSARKSSTGDSSTGLTDGDKTKTATVKTTASRLVTSSVSGVVAPTEPAASVAAPPPKPTSAAASAHVAPKPLLTGRKTATKKSSSSDVNVFSGGKQPRARTGVADLEVDKGRKAKFFGKKSWERKAVLRARERDDQAPSIDQIAPHLFAPGFGMQKAQPAQQEQIPQGVDNGRSEPTAAELSAQEQRRAISPVPVARSNSMAETSAISSRAPKRALSSSPQRPSKRPTKSSLNLNADRSNRETKKTVRFTEVEVESPVEIESSVSQEPSTYQSASRLLGECYPSTQDDDGLFVSEPMDIDDISDAPSPDPIPLPSATGSKALYLSTNASRASRSVGKKVKLSTSPSILDMTFSAIPTSVIGDGQWLHDFLSIECLDLSHTFLAESIIAQFPIQDFRHLCSGLVTSDNNSKCLELLAEHLRVGSYGLFMARARFNLVLFPTKCAEFNKLSDYGVEAASPGSAVLKYFTFSSANPIFQLLRPSPSTVDALKAFVGKEKLVLFPPVLGVQYSSLIAPSDETKKRMWHFYLAFPERSMDWQRSIGSWLHMRDSKCKLYTNFDPGSWLAFVQASKGERGAVIIHEALIPFVRRFPHFHKLCIKSNFVVWRFSESLDNPQPFKKSNIIPVISNRFSRIFPHGHVILVTPSFLISEPQQAYTLFEWFFEQRAKSPTNKLVVAYNIVQWLTDLSGEKIELRALLEKTIWTRKTAMEVAIDKNLAALTDEDQVARQKTWCRLDCWLTSMLAGQVPFSDVSPVIFADRSIDPHDEQSLVNWFGSWSMGQIQDYRRFYVVGSSNSLPTNPDHTLTSKASRRILFPRYARSAVNDPDEAMRISLAKSQPASVAQPVVQSASPNYWLHSQRFNNDENQIHPWLSSLPSRFAKLYNRPISWADMDMADHLGDFKMQFATIQQWWDYMHPFTSMMNTHVAFFYTIADEWLPESFPKGVKPKRHPWLAIWRPCDVHNKYGEYAHGRTELVIWDVRAGAELETNPLPGIQDLTWMQRALVHHIQMHAHSKSPKYRLENVWLGGFAAQQNNMISTLPVDKTAEYLQRMIVNLRDTVPTTSYLPGHHFRLVPLANQNQHVSTNRVGQGNNDPGDDNDPDTRIIFHPPRGGENLQPAIPSRCTNTFYEAARLARMRNVMCKEVYTWPPTMTWYQKQVNEGRHFEHIMVDGWEQIFQQIQVGVDRSSTASAAAAAAFNHPQAPSRTGSVGSNHSMSPD